MKTFSKKYLVEELDLPYEAEEENPIGSTRWSNIYRIIFRDKDGKYYMTEYSRGATEYQEEQPWEFESEVDCWEVELKEAVTKKWVKV